MYYFGEPGELFLYDSTNGFLYLGWVLDFSIKEKALFNKTIERQRRRYDADIEISASLGRSHQSLLNAIRAREGVKQTVYFTGLLSASKISNLYLTVEQRRKSGSKADLHNLVITGNTNNASNITQYANLLGEDGSFEKDSNSDGVGDGWTDGATNASIVSSFISGGGNAQRVNFGSWGDFFRYDITAPFDGQRRISAHIQAKEYTGAAVADISFGIKTLDSAGNVISTYSDAYSFSAGQTRQLKKELLVRENQTVYQIRVFAEYAGSGGEVVFDNGMVNFGNYADFMNN